MAASASSFLPLALEYASQGWAILPLQSRGKLPRIAKADGGNGWKDATTSPDQVSAWWTQWPTANIGFAPRGQLLIIDIDPRNGGKAAWAKLSQEITMPETRRVRTGSGYHIYYSLPDGLTLPSCDLPGYAGLEIKCETGYVLLPPSIHPDGPVYTWMNPETPIATAPDALVALLLPRKESKSQEWKQERPQGSVIDAYNARYSIYEQLERYGYISAGRDRYKRPGGRSASVVVLEGSRSYHHSNSDELHSDKTHDAFSIYCHFEHQGDVKAAVKGAADLLGMRKASEPRPRAGPEEQPTTKADIHLTDTGNAMRLAALFGRDIRYCPEWKSWLVWTGQYWQRDVGELRLLRMAKEVTRSMLREAAKLAADLADEEETDEAKAQLKTQAALQRWALASQNTMRLHAMVKLAQSEPGIAITAGELDTDKYLLNVENGTLELHTGALRDHRQEDYITRMAPVTFDATATAPRWLDFITWMMAGKPEITRFLQQAVGYSLTGDTSEQCFYLLWGEGSNGKSTFLEVLAALLGEYALQTPADTLMIKQQEGVPNDLARMRGARLVTTIETEDGKRLAEARLKQLTGGDKVSARFLHAEWFDFKPEFKLFLATNHKPNVRGTDEGIWRRVRLIPFTQKVTPDQRDPHLAEKLQQELSGILNWALFGCLDWQQNGHPTPEAVQAATATYRQAMDPLQSFLDEECVITPNAKVTASALYKAYCAWAEENHEHTHSQRKFGEALSEKGFISVVERVSGKPQRLWQGVGLLTENPPPQPEERYTSHDQSVTHSNPDGEQPEGLLSLFAVTDVTEKSGVFQNFDSHVRENPQNSGNICNSNQPQGHFAPVPISPDRVLQNSERSVTQASVNGTSALQPDETPSQARLRVVREEELKAARRRKHIEEARELLPRLTIWQRWHFRASMADYPAFARIPATSPAWAQYLGWYESQSKTDARYLQYVEHAEQAFIQQFGDCFAEKDGPHGL